LIGIVEKGCHTQEPARLPSARGPKCPDLRWDQETTRIIEPVYGERMKNGDR
jgi:hypothetical protein